MNVKKMWPFLLSAFLMVLWITPTQAQTTLKYGLINPPQHSSYGMGERFGKLVKERTSGKVEIKLFPSQQLVRSTDWFQNVRMGTVDIASGAISLLEGIVPQISILDAPYLIEDMAHAQLILKSPIVTSWNDILIKKGGVRSLAWWVFGIRSLLTKKPVYSPNDLFGEKLRDAPSPILLATLEGMGATAVPLDWGEVYTALQTGVVAGIVNPPEFIHNSGIYEVANNYSLTKQTFIIQPILMNEASFQRFSHQVQGVLIQSAQEAANWQWNKYFAEEKEYLRLLKEKGVNIIDVNKGLDLNAFRKRVRGYVIPKFTSKWGEGVYEQLRVLSRK